MIKGFIIQKVLLISILEIPIFIDLKNDKTDSKSDELEIPVTWTLRRLFLYTVRQILSPKRKTLLVLCCLNSFKWGVSSFLTTKLHFTFLSLSFRLILNLYRFLSLYQELCCLLGSSQIGSGTDQPRRLGWKSWRLEVYCLSGTPISSQQPFGPGLCPSSLLDFVHRILWVLRPCNPCIDVSNSEKSNKIIKKFKKCHWEIQNISQ